METLDEGLEGGLLIRAGLEKKNHPIKCVGAVERSKVLRILDRPGGSSLQGLAGGFLDRGRNAGGERDGLRNRRDRYKGGEKKGTEELESVRSRIQGRVLGGGRC